MRRIHRGETDSGWRRLCQCIARDRCYQSTRNTPLSVTILTIWVIIDKCSACSYIYKMRAVGIRELKNKLSEFLRVVRKGDVVLVTDRASFTAYYVEAGFSPDGGWTAILPDVIGRTRASSVQLLNQTITAAQALDWGLATAHTDSVRVDQAVADLCGQLLGKKAGSMRCTRRLLRPPDLESRLEEERQRFVAQIATAEARAGIRTWLGDD